MSSSCDIYVGNFPYSLFASAGITNAVSGQALIVLNGTTQPCSYHPSPSFNQKAVRSMSPRIDGRPSLPRNAYHSRSSQTNAPRTALGHDVNGRIMTLQVDGDESKNTGTSTTFKTAFQLHLCRAISRHRFLTPTRRYPC
jgi:hypothetical protein